MKRTFAKFLIFVGILCYAWGSLLYWQRTNPNRLSFTTNAMRIFPTVTRTQKEPTLLKIQKLHISLPIVPSRITNGVWETTSSGISYWINSPQPGEKGNSVFYGHNWTSLFAKLPQIKPGDTITIQFADKSTESFEVAYTMSVSPDQVDILNPSRDRRITVYTCTGFLDSKRFVAVALLK